MKSSLFTLIVVVIALIGIILTDTIAPANVHTEVTVAFAFMAFAFSFFYWLTCYQVGETMTKGNNNHPVINLKKNMSENKRSVVDLEKIAA